MRPAYRRLIVALMVSLSLHGLLLSMTFGDGGFGLPGLGNPWKERRVMAPPLTAILLPPSPAASPTEPTVPVRLERSVAAQVVSGGVALKPAASLSVPSPSAAATPAIPAAPTTRSDDNAFTAIAPPVPVEPVVDPPALISVERATTPTFRVPRSDGSAPPLRLDAALPAIERIVIKAKPETADDADAAQRRDEARREAAQRAAEFKAAQRIEQARQTARIEAATVAAAAAASALAMAKAAEDARGADVERIEAQQREAARLAAEKAQAERTEAARQELARQEAAKLEAARIEAARKESERLDAQRLATAKQDAQRVEAMRVEAARVEAARVEAARVEAARIEAARVEAAKQEAARIEASRVEAARLEAARIEAARVELARQQAIERDAQRAAAEKEAARLREEQAEDARRDARRQAMARILADEAAQRDAAAKAAEAAHARSPSASGSLLPLSIGSARRGRLWGRADPNAALVEYAESVARKIQFNTPAETIRDIGQRQHNPPMITIALRSDGSVESVVIVNTSGAPEVDAAIRRLIDSHANYPAFSPALAREFDVIEIRRTWHVDNVIRLQ
jgi:hypothetical protein